VENEETFGDLDNIAREHMTGEECTVQLENTTQRTTEAETSVVMEV